MYSAAKSQYSFIFNIFDTSVLPKLSRNRIILVPKLIRLHKRHSLVVVSVVVNRFVLFLVRYVFTVRATLHEKNTYDMSLGLLLTSGFCLIAAFFENVWELVIAKVVRNNRHSLIDIVHPYRPLASSCPFIFYSCFLCFEFPSILPLSSFLWNHCMQASY